MRYIIWDSGSTRLWNVEDTKRDAIVEGNIKHQSDAQKIADDLNQKDSDAKETEAYAEMELARLEEQGEIVVDRSNTVQALAEDAMRSEERYYKHLFDAKYGV
jgi:hypothetical protein